MLFVVLLAAKGNAVAFNAIESHVTIFVDVFSQRSNSERGA